MTEGIGVDGIHCVSRTCDLCGDACDANTQELNVLSCTFAKCEDLCYHQDCLEKYLKSIRLERNRKTGFKCPRGCGKSSAYKDPCPGKIDKSHPIHPRNEEQKKKKKAKVPEIAALVATRPKTKEEKKAERAAAAAKTQAATAAADKGKAAKQPVAGSLKAGGVSTAQPAVSTVKARPPLPPDPKKQLAEALAAARRELAAGKQSREPTPTQTAAAPAAPEYKTLDMYYKENAASSSNLSSISSAAAAAAAAPVANAWAKPPVPAAAAVRHKATAAAEAHNASSSKLAAAGHAAPAAVVHSVSSAVKQGIQLQRADAAAAAAAAAAGQPPPPPPPPPPPDQQHGLVAARIGSGVHSAAEAGSSSAAAAANGHLPIGMEYLAEEDQQHLTKAQRKNLKRAEKKKKKEESVGNAAAGSPNAQPEASARTDSAAGPTAASTSGNAAASSSNWASTSPSQVDAAAAATAGSSSVAATAADDLADDAESSALLYELAVQALLAHRTLELVASLQRLGFTDWQAAAAVQRHGSDIEVAVAWLLDGGAPDAAAAASVGMGCVAHVDIADDLALMEQLAAALPQIPKPRLYQAVADTAGDLDAAAAVCLQQATMSDSQQSAAEEVPAAAAETGSYAFGLVPAAPDASMQQYASGDCNRVDSSSLFASSSFYSNAPLTAAAGVGALSPRGDAVYNGWLEDSSLGLSSLQQQQQHLLPGNDSSHLRNATNMPTSSSGFNHLGSTHTAAVAGPGLGNSIWATDNNVAGQAGISSIWGTAGAGGSLFGIGSSGNGLYGLDNAFGSILQNGPVTNSGDLLSGSGLGFVEAAGSGLNLQESLSAADPVLESFGSGNVFGLNNAATAATAAGGGGNAAAAAGGSAGVSAALQGSRLFQAYGWRQQPLFGEQQQQGMQQQGSTLAVAAAVNGPVSGDVDEPDLEGLMATLMCH